MKEEKEKKEEIVVLDAGIDMESMDDPDGLCCTAPLTPFRW